METDEYPFIIDYLISGAVSYWESTISASRFVLDVISGGYKLPFRRVPVPCFARNNRSAELHLSFVEEDISKLLVEACH